MLKCFSPFGGILDRSSGNISGNSLPIGTNSTVGFSKLISLTRTR